MKFRYIQLANDLENNVSKGIYKAGEKLPSLRNLHTLTGLSISTVYQAYIELESRGVIEAKEKSGFFVKPLLSNILPLPGFKRHKTKPQKPAINTIVESIYQAIGDDALLPLGAAVPAVELLPMKQISTSTRAATRKYLKDDCISYATLKGIPELQRLLSNRSIGYIGNINQDDIIITNGCLEAIILCLKAVTNPGDTVAVESPTFGWYLQLIEDLNMMAIEVPTDPVIGIDLKSFKKVTQRHKIKACILNPNFQNPLGFKMPEEKKKEMVRFCNQKKIPIIEDDIYGDLFFSKSRPKTLKYYDRKGLVLYCTSFSKTLAPDLRVGWALPGKYTRQVNRLKFNTNIATSKLNQLIIIDFLKTGYHDRHLRKLRNALRNQVVNTAMAIKKYFPDGTKISAPEGGFIIWIQLNETVDCLELFYKAVENKIFILPGLMSSSMKKYKSCIRISCGNPFTPEIEKGIMTLGEIIGSM